jgi:tRNA (cytidine32/guanosine34-2'-O)-methyltransferase
MDTEVTEPNRPNLIKKKNTKSAAWNFFGIEADEHGVSIPSQEHRPICWICYKSVPCKTGNTTNLFTHLRERHPDAYKEANQGNMNRKKASRSQGMQPTLETVVERSTRYDPKGSQAKELNHAVAYFLAKDMQPLQTVEKPGFQKMIAKFDTSSLRESTFHTKKFHAYIIR